MFNLTFRKSNARSNSGTRSIAKDSRTGWGFKTMQACPFGVLDGLLFTNACFLEAGLSKTPTAYPQLKLQSLNFEVEILKLAF